MDIFQCHVLRTKYRDCWVKSIQFRRSLVVPDAADRRNVTCAQSCKLHDTGLNLACAHFAGPISMVVGSRVKPGTMRRRIEDNAFPHRIFPVVAAEKQAVTDNPVLAVREDLDDKTSVYRVIGQYLPFEGPGIIIINGYSADFHILRPFHGERRHGTMKHEIRFITCDADIFHIFQKECHKFVSAVIVRDVKEFLRCLLRIERIHALSETEGYVSFRMVLEDFPHNGSIVRDRRIELHIHCLPASGNGADKSEENRYCSDNIRNHVSQSIISIKDSVLSLRPKRQ